MEFAKKASCFRLEGTMLFCKLRVANVLLTVAVSVAVSVAVTIAVYYG